MPTKTERILSYLPHTFCADERNPVLHTVVNAFGVELLKAENSLAAVMAAHWVDHADRGGDAIDDLEKLAALYGLLPRDDESVEEFREHLKRYVRTFLEGTVTVQGVLRVAAEALGLHIADEYEHEDETRRLDTWWTRRSHALTSTESRSDNAAPILLGFHAAHATGSPSERARIHGMVDLDSEIDVRWHRYLHIGVDDAAAVEIDLQQFAEDAAQVTHAELIQAIDAGVGSGVASIVQQTLEDGPVQNLVLESPTSGEQSRVVVQPLALRQSHFDGQFVTRAIVTDEAAMKIFGFVARQAYGTAADHFKIASADEIDLRRGVDLRDTNILRLSVDGQPAIEIDCAGARPRATLITEVVDAINGVLPELASSDGKRITLTAPTAGADGSIGFAEGPNDARPQLFGGAPRVTVGADAAPATIVGDDALLGAVDLGERGKIRLAVNAEPAVDIDVAGASATATSLDEIVDAINAVFPGMAAATDEDKLRLTAPASDGPSFLALLPLRYLDLIEYPGVTTSSHHEGIRHGDSWSIENSGACDVAAQITVTAPSGTYRPAIVNLTLGHLVRVLAVLGRGDTLKLHADPQGKLHGTIVTADGEQNAVSLEQLEVGSLHGPQPIAAPKTERPDATVLTLPRGESRWGYLDCHVSRFDHARFAASGDPSGARFAGGKCQDRGAFNVSPFENREGTAPPEDATTVFAPTPPLPDPAVGIRFDWQSRNAGAFCVNLPADLPARFGGRFNEARFGQRVGDAAGASSPNRYSR